MNYKIQAALKTFDQEEIPSSVHPEMPLLNDLHCKLKANKETFEGVDAVFIQHHLGPFVARILAMSEDGLEFGRCWLVDIPYSTNTDVKNELLKLGIPESQMTRPFNNPLADYEIAQQDRVAFLMQRVADRDNPRPLLVVDDGAHFIRHLKNALIHDPKYAMRFKGTKVVEQTTRGHRFITSKEGRDVIKKLDLSVVSIARCKTKTLFEAPFIGAAVSRALFTSIEQRSHDIRNVGVIGYGRVGKATVDRLVNASSNFRIYVVDIDPKARAQASTKKNCEGVKALPTHIEYQLILGCTGYNSFKLNQRHLLADGAILASGSSAAIEFNRAGFIELADEYPNDDIKIMKRGKTIHSGIHADITISHEGRKEFTFLSAGFPINFDGRIEHLPIQMIQATHCLLYAAAIETKSHLEPGIFRIRDENDRWIYKHALQHLEKK